MPKVIHVAGSDRERGRQHAEQVGSACRTGMPDFYLKLIQRLLSQKPKRWSGRLIQSVGAAFLDPVVNRFLKQVPTSHREQVEGMAEAAGLEARGLLTALVLPDLLPVLQGRLNQAFPRWFVEVKLPAFGCTSFISRGDRFLVGRNLDFPGVGYWDRYPVLQASTPLKGLRSLSFTTAGVPVGGITGINEAQISVFIHQHFCKSVSSRGTLPFLVADQILNEARTLSEAKSILERARLASGWAFVVADGKKRTGFLWEGTARSHGVIPLDQAGGVLAHSNYFQTRVCQSQEFAATARMNWDSFARKMRLEFLIRSAGSSLTPQQAALALCDHWDPQWEEEKVSNRTVSMALNIQSLVLDPEKMEAWFAVGDSPVNMGHFQKFNVQEVLEGHRGEAPESFPAYRFRDESKARAKRSFIESFVSALDGRDDDALIAAEAALAACFTAEMSQIAGVMYLKKHQWEKAAECFERSIAWIESKMQSKSTRKLPPEYFECLLFLARSLDLRSRHTEARQLYERVLKSPDLEDGNIRRIASSKRSFDVGDIDRLFLPFSTYIPFS